jgi:hypothetical protein
MEEGSGVGVQGSGFRKGVVFAAFAVMSTAAAI